MRAGLHKDLLPQRTRLFDLPQARGGGEMYDDDRHVRQLRHFQQAADGLGLQLACGLLFRDQRVDHPGIFAVDAGDAAQLFQLLQGAENVLVADHHGRVGQVHLKRRNALLKHFGQLRDDLLVPVVYGHVEAVVAGGAAVGLLVPQVKAVLQSLAFVRAGKVDDHGRAAAQCGAAAGAEVVGGRCVADIQIKVCVRVDEAGEKQLAGNVDDLRIRAGKPRRDGGDLLAVNEDVGGLTAGCVDDGAAAK